MADPMPYEVSYSFSGFQQTNPVSPLPAGPLDAEFANIEDALASTNDALADIRRSDGQLQNQTVGPDQLSAALNLGFTNRGTWTEGFTYNSGDGVAYSEIFYTARLQHVATAGNRPDLSPATWSELFPIAAMLIPDGTVVTAMLADNAVTNAKLADNAITNAKLADDVITLAELNASVYASSGAAVTGTDTTALMTAATTKDAINGRQILGVVSATVPQYSATSDTDTGFGVSAADTAYVMTGGFVRAVFGTATTFHDSAGTQIGRFASTGSFQVGDSSYTGADITDPGVNVAQSGIVSITSNATAAMFLNRQAGAGNIVELYAAASFGGAISQSGATVTYGTFCGSHWSQMARMSKPHLLRGTIVETIDEMCEWPDEVNEHLPKFKVSDTTASSAVYGVFMGWSMERVDRNDPESPERETHDATIAALGTYMVRMAPGEIVKRGDLIESNGDGCGRVQADDIMRASTVAKITSPVAAEVYPDGSYLVPCTLHCG